MGAVDPKQDVFLVRERFAQAINRIPILKGIIRSNPVDRGILSPLQEVRRAVVALVDTPYQFERADGDPVSHGQSVESVIKARRNTELAQSLGYLSRSYAEYVKDGPVGSIGRITAPIIGRFGHLAGLTRKMTRDEFYNEVGLAMSAGDIHPIPQVAKAAAEIRKTIFDRAMKDAIDVGIFDPDLKVKFADSYFMRVYNAEKIAAHMGDGTADDISVILREEFGRKRDEASRRLVEDRNVEDIQGELGRLKEQASQAQVALNRATKRAKGKKSRAEGAIKRESAVSRATAGLRKRFERRQRVLMQQTGKGYIPPSDTSWRAQDIRVVDEFGDGSVVQAGKVFDVIEKRQKVARELLECLDG